MSKVIIDRDDKDRAIITETLPYEAPIIFSDEGLYRYKKKEKVIGYKSNDDSEKTIVNNLLSPRNKYTIPYNYTIRNNLNSLRNLSVVHPKSQLAIASFYNKFSHQMLHLCSLSPVSIRFPSSVASYFFENENKGDIKVHKADIVEEDVGGFDVDLIHASSYFSYKKHNLLYKFFTSREFFRLEKRFHKLIMFDVSKCFSSIYTHSISWAVKDKEFSKKHKNSYSFESEFDQLMQNSNYNETNGIVIGPEVSRIFAEIILQRIDCDCVREIDSLLGVKHNMQYSIRRYVDDYFLYTNSKELEIKILSIIQKNMEVYNFYINNSKTIPMDVPFSTDLTIARYEVKEYLDDVLGDIYNIRENVIQLSSGTVVSRKIIEKIKSILKTRGVNYFAVSSLIIGRLKRLALTVVGNNLECDSSCQNRVKKLIDVVIEVTFFVYSMDTRVRTTYVVSQSLIFLNHSLRKYDVGIVEDVRKRLFDESLHVLMENERATSCFSSEKQNLLIAISDLGADYLIPQSLLLTISGYKKDSNTNVLCPIIEHDYFQIVSLLFYIKDFSIYDELSAALELTILSKIFSQDDFQYYSELIMLLFDSISCPYISKETKLKLSQCAVIAAGGASNNSNGINNRFLTLSSSQEWFTSWSAHIDLGYLLHKKELKPPYE